MSSENALQTFMAEIQAYARVIEAQGSLLPKLCDDNDYDCFWIEVDEPLKVYRYLYRERGETEVLSQSADKDIVLERIFSEVTFSLALDYEVKHRIDGQDFRRQFFAVQVNMMRLLKPEWGDNEAKRHADILKENPFMDKMQ